MNATQKQIVDLHKQSKNLKKITHTVEDEQKISQEIFRLRRQLIAELYPKV